MKTVRALDETWEAKCRGCSTIVVAHKDSLLPWYCDECKKKNRE